MKRITLTLKAPYVGLRPFGEREALLFFGREQHTRELLSKLESKQRFIAVLGASGTGKSSLVRAGLVPALHRGALASAGHNWNVCIVKPGDAPLTNLAQALTEHEGWRDSDNRADAVASLSATLATSPLALTDLYRQKAEHFSRQALLLVVDQFEEIFRYRQKNVDEAEAFINLLLRSSTEDVPIYIVMTMRSDFLGNCVAFFGLPEAINQGIYLTPRLGPDQLKSIIASPLALVGGEIDPVLVNRLVNTLGGEDELPILEHALLRMWNRAQAAGRTKIETEDFESVCASNDEQASQPQLACAIDNHASEIYNGLFPERKFIARQLFLALVERRDGREVRRPQTVKQLVESVSEQERENVLAVIEAFRANDVGFLLPAVDTPLNNDRMIDISHESLFRQWRLFRQWLDEEELDVAELREWQQRTARQIDGGSWLDEYDCERADRWRARVTERGNPAAWVKRYQGAVHYREVSQYIEESLARVQVAKVEKAWQEQEARAAEAKRLELEAEVQRQAAERAEGERLQAEKEKQQAQAYATESRRKTRIALVGVIVAVAFFVMAAGAAWWANHQNTLVVGMERDAVAGKLVAKAENLTASSPDQGALLALSAWRIGHDVKAEALIRAASTKYYGQIVLRGHEDRLTSVQFAPDGKMVVTASDDKTARLWDVASGKELHVLRGHESRVVSVQFAPDGRAVVTAGGDKTARLWDVASGKELHVLRGHESRVVSAQFAPDGRAVVTASGDKTARLWDVGSGRELRVLRGHEAVVTSVQFAPDGKTVVTASEDRTARLWDVGSGRELRVLRGHEAAVTSVQFSPDGKTVVTVVQEQSLFTAGVKFIGFANKARLWDVASGKELFILMGGGVTSAQFAVDGKTVVTTSYDKTARLWDIVTGTELHVLRGHVAAVTSAQFASDGRVVVTASGDGTARLWEVRSGREFQVLHGHEDRIVSVQFAPGGRTVATASDDKTARLWDVASGKELHVLRGHEGGVASAQFAPDGKTVVTANGKAYSQDRTARIWDVESGKELHILRGHEDYVVSAQFASDGRVVVTASGDGTARLWEVRSGREFQVLHGHEDRLTSVQFAPDGKMVVTASDDKTARLWDVASGKELHVLRGHEGAVRHVEFAPDGKVVVTASSDRTARLWEVGSGKELHVLRGHEGGVASAKFSPDGETVVTASGDKTARLWDVASGKELQVLRGHEESVVSAQFAPDGKTVVTTSLDRTIRLWEVMSHIGWRVLRGHEESVRSAQFAPDGRTVVTASDDKTARLWDVASGKELQALGGHEEVVLYAKFSPDGQAVVTGSGDKTARLWRCLVCRPVDELAAQLQKTIGRDLTDEERRRLGVPDWVPPAK